MNTKGLNGNQLKIIALIGVVLRYWQSWRLVLIVETLKNRWQE